MEERGIPDTMISAALSLLGDDVSDSCHSKTLGYEIIVVI